MTTSSIVSFGISIGPSTRSSYAVEPSSGMRKRIAPSSTYAAPSSTSRCASAWHAPSVELERDLAVPLEPQPPQETLDLLRRFGHLAAGVRVLDPQEELAPLVAGEEPVEERRADVTDMQEPRRARRHADTNGHGSRLCGGVLIGAHCGGGIKGAIGRAVEIGADALQLFAQPNRAWRFPDHDPAVLASFCENREEAGIGAAFIHALYLLNLASENPDFYEKSTSALRRSAETASAIGAEGVCFHTGSHLGGGLEDRSTASRQRSSRRSKRAPARRGS